MDFFAVSRKITGSKGRSSLLTRRTIAPSVLLILWLHDWLAQSHLLLATRTTNLAALAETVHRKWSPTRLCRLLTGCWPWAAATPGRPAVFITWKAANTS